MGKPTVCIGENKGADQLRSNCEADQRLCFRYSDSTIPLLLKSKISSFWLFSVLVQVGLCRTYLETTLLVFPRGGSYIDELLYADDIDKNVSSYKQQFKGQWIKFHIPLITTPYNLRCCATTSNCKVIE